MQNEYIPEEDRERWKFDKRIPISVLLVLLSQAAAGLWVIADMRKDIEVQKAMAVDQHQRLDRQDRALEAAVAVLRSDIREVAASVNRLVQK